jgi:DNA-binding NarL/FixJ family response regulator
MSRENCGVRVFLLAESRLFRDVFVRVLARRNDIRVVGAGTPSLQSLSEVIAANPDVLLCDSLGPALSTGELLLEVRRNLPAVSIVMFGMDTDQDKFLTAVHRGVTGYVLKDASAADIADAIRAVSNGESVCPPTLCRVLFDHVAGSEDWRPGVRARQNLGLTR